MLYEYFFQSTMLQMVETNFLFSLDPNSKGSFLLPATNPPPPYYLHVCVHVCVCVVSAIEENVLPGFEVEEDWLSTDADQGPNAT